jgi:dihydrofolate reductase
LNKAKWTNTTIIAGEDLAQEVADLKKETNKDLLLAGGTSLAKAFAEKNLIDEYRLLIVPKVIGGGTTFLEGIKNRLKLKLLSARALKTGTVAMHYAKG